MELRRGGHVRRRRSHARAEGLEQSDRLAPAGPGRCDGTRRPRRRVCGVLGESRRRSTRRSPRRGVGELVVAAVVRAPRGDPLPPAGRHAALAAVAAGGSRRGRRGRAGHVRRPPRTRATARRPGDDQAVRDPPVEHDRDDAHRRRHRHDRGSGSDRRRHGDPVPPRHEGGAGPAQVDRLRGRAVPGRARCLGDREHRGWRLASRRHPGPARPGDRRFQLRDRDLGAEVPPLRHRRRRQPNARLRNPHRGRGRRVRRIGGRARRTPRIAGLGRGDRRRDHCGCRPADPRATAARRRPVALRLPVRSLPGLAPAG